MKHICLAFALITLLSTPGLAMTSSTTQEWTFPTAPSDPNNIPPDPNVSKNRFGVPNGIAPNSGWSEAKNGQTGILQLLESADFVIPNANIRTKRKVGKVEVVYRLDDGSILAEKDRPKVRDDSGATGLTISGRDSADVAVGDQGWRRVNVGFESLVNAGCPSKETLTITPPQGHSICIDSVKVTSDCVDRGIPTLSSVGVVVLATLLLLASLLLLKRKQSRDLILPGSGSD